MRAQRAHSSHDDASHPSFTSQTPPQQKNLDDVYLRSKLTRSALIAWAQDIS